MTSPTVSVQLPEHLFQRLKHAADLTHRTIEEITVTALEAALPPAPDLPSEVAEELAAFHLFSDEALWAAAEPSLSPTEERRLSQLNAAAGERKLTSAEEAEQQKLISAYQRSVLRRAKALTILAQRGHHIPISAEAETSENGGN